MTDTLQDIRDESSEEDVPDGETSARAEPEHDDDERGCSVEGGLVRL